MNILELLRLRSAPWLTLIISVVAWFALWAIMHGVTVTSAVTTFLLALGLPTGVANGAMTVHDWLLDAPRVTWASWSAVILAVAVGARYVRAVYNQRESSNDRNYAGRAVSNAKSRPLNDETRRMTDEMYAQMVKFAEADYAKAAKYDQKLQKFEQESQLRCAAVTWLIAATVVELNGSTMPDLIAVGLATTLTTVLIVVGVAALIAVLIACAMEEFYDAYEAPATAERFKDTVQNFAWEAFFLAYRLALVLLALPLFVLGIFLYPASSNGD